MKFKGVVLTLDKTGDISVMNTGGEQGARHSPEEVEVRRALCQALRCRGGMPSASWTMRGCSASNTPPITLKPHTPKCGKAGDELPALLGFQMSQDVSCTIQVPESEMESHQTMQGLVGGHGHFWGSTTAGAETFTKGSLLSLTHVGALVTDQTNDPVLLHVLSQAIQITDTGSAVSPVSLRMKPPLVLFT